MKAVLISIRPERAEKILSGEKTVDIRKTRPKLKTPFKCYIYYTFGRVTIRGVEVDWDSGELFFDRYLAERADPYRQQKVVAEFTCDYIREYKNREPSAVWAKLMKSACVDGRFLENYSGKKMFGWHISDLKVYDKPKEIFNFYKPGAPTPEKLEDTLCDYCEKTDYGEHKNYGTPNGPVMCEGAWCGEAYQEYLDQNFMVTRPPQSWYYVEELEEEK